MLAVMKGNYFGGGESRLGSILPFDLSRSGESVQAGDRGAGAETRVRVLVVEDNADTRMLVDYLLRKKYDVVCTSSGEDALALATESRFNALLVDINLGKGKSGEDVLHEIKAIPGYEKTPIVAVTAYAMPGDRERFFSEGFDNYISKPFSKQRLLEALECVLD